MAFDETTWDFKDDLVVDESNFCKWWRKVDDKFVKFLWIFCNSSVHKIYAKKLTHQKVFWSLFCFMLEGKIVFKQGVKFMNGVARLCKMTSCFLFFIFPSKITCIHCYTFPVCRFKSKPVANLHNLNIIPNSISSSRFLY